MSRILVADDDHELLFELADLLEESGHEVETAVDGVELMEAIAELPFDLIITDVSMPWSTGTQAAQAARYAGLDTPMLVITALQHESIGEQVEKLGNRARMLRKPFDLESFTRAVEALLAPAAQRLHTVSGDRPANP